MVLGFIDIVFRLNDIEFRLKEIVFGCYSIVFGCYFIGFRPSGYVFVLWFLFVIDYSHLPIYCWPSLHNSQGLCIMTLF